LSRQEVAKILHIGLSTLDSLITEKELPRTRIKKRVFVLQQDLENYILANRNTGGEK
jgi:excisionase family DNA binding protein